MNIDNIKLQLSRYTVSAWRRRWLGLVVAWVFCLLFWVVVSIIPDKYESTARVHADSDSVITPMLRGVALSSPADSTIDLLQRTLLSRPNLETIIHNVDALNLHIKTPEQMDALTAQLAAKIKLVSQRKDLFSITYTDNSPDLAHDVVDQVVNIFKENANKTSQNSSANAETFINKEIEDYEAKLKEAEQRRAAFQIKYIDLLPGANGAASHLDQIRESIEHLQGELQDIKARRDLIENQMKTTPEMLSSAQYVSHLHNANVTTLTPLQTAERDLTELREKFTERNPEVIAAKKKVEILKEAERSTQAAPESPDTMVPNPIYQHLAEQDLEAKSSIASLERQIAQVSSELSRLSDIAHKAPQVLAEFMGLDRDYNTFQMKYKELLDKREELRIGSAAQVSANQTHIDVIEEASYPHTPSGPPRKIFVGASLFIGLGIGVMAAVAMAYLDTSFYAANEMNDMAFPLIGSLSSSKRRTRSGVFANLLFFLMTTGLFIVFVGLEATSFWVGKI
jgi:polysaccharide chain length determinant protein (PEP-CTERM system associated)